MNVNVNRKKEEYDELINCFRNEELTSEELFDQLDQLLYEQNIEDFKYILLNTYEYMNANHYRDRLVMHASEIQNYKYLYHYGSVIIEDADSSFWRRIGNMTMLGFYYVDQDEEKFIQFYNENKELLMMELGGFLYTRKGNKLIEFVVSEKSLIFSGVYVNAIGEVLFPSKDVPANLELTGKLFDAIEYLVEEHGEDELMHGYNCVSVSRGTYEYFLGNFEKAESILEDCAYTSTEYCNCGVAALLTYNFYRDRETAEEINKSIVLNSVNGLKLIAPDMYIDAKFKNNVNIYFYYAYYALKGTEGFEIDRSIELIEKENETEVFNYYYLAKLYNRKNDKSKVQELIDKIKLLKEKGVDLHIEKYLEVIDNIDCELYIPEFYPEPVK